MKQTLKISIIALLIYTLLPFGISNVYPSHPAVDSRYKHSLGLKSDGTVVAVGNNYYGQLGVSGWTNVVQVDSGFYHSLGLKSDGTVVAVGNNDNGQCNVSGWTNIVQVAAGWYHSLGVKSDGTVVAVGYNYFGQLLVSGWTNVVQVAGGSHSLGLKSDGTVVAVGLNSSGQCDVSGWTNVVQVAGGSHSLGVKSDGTVVAVGNNSSGQCNLGGWTNVVQVDSGYNHSLGLKSDGTVVAVGNNDNGQCNVSGWTNIVQVAAGYNNSLGLKTDGTVVAVGSNAFGQLDVSGWNLGTAGGSLEITKINFPIFGSKRIGIEGKVYVNGQPKPFALIGGEDPVNQVSSMNFLQADENGHFTYISNSEPKSGLYIYRFYIQETGEWFNVSIPVKNDNDSGNYITDQWISVPEIEIEKGTSQYFSDETYLYGELVSDSANKPEESAVIDIAKTSGKILLKGIGNTLAEYASNPYNVIASFGALTCVIPDPTVTKVVCAASIKVIVAGVTVSAAKGFSKAALEQTNFSEETKQKWNRRIDEGAAAYSMVDISNAGNVLQVSSDLYTVSSVLYSTEEPGDTSINLIQSVKSQSVNTAQSNYEYLYMVTKDINGKIVLVGIMAPKTSTAGKAMPWIPLLLLNE